MGVRWASAIRAQGQKGGEKCVRALPPSWEAAGEGAVGSGLCLFDLEKDPFVKEDRGGPGA